MRPTISIITPVRNGERFIRGCVQNVIAQCCPEIEHIIIDGASTDETVAILREIAATNSHLRIVSEPDRGQSDALNKGIALVKADYIGILNVDDFYEPGTLNRVCDLIRNSDRRALLVANCRVVGEDDRVLYTNMPRDLDIDRLLVGEHFYAFPYNPSQYFYPKRLHEILGPYDISEHFVMDIKFLFAAVQNIETRYFDEIWGNFRFVKGTKTFDDTVSGKSAERKRRVYRQFFSRRPMRNKLAILALSISCRLRKRYWDWASQLRRHRHSKPHASSSPDSA